MARSGGWLLAVCFMLAGCALLPSQNPDQPAEKPNVPSAPAAPASSSATVSYRVVINAPDNLKKLLTTYLDLTRFQNAPQTDGITNSELTRLAAAAPAQARALLESEGHFQPVVTVARSDPDGAVPLITLNVNPGPRVLVTSYDLEVTGDLRKRADGGDEDSLALMRRAQRRWQLKPGENFSQAEWSSAKNATLALLRAEGYPLAAVADSQARIEAKLGEAELAMTVDTGPKFFMGPLQIEGTQRYSEDAIRNIAEFSPGTPYTEKRLLDFQERIGKLGLFSTVSAEIDANPETAAAAPVLVKVGEQKLQQAVAGIGFSDNTRERITLEHWHRRPFGFAVQAHNKIELGRYYRAWESELLSDPTKSEYRNLLAGSISRLQTVNDITATWRLRAGRSRYTERIERLIFAELLSSNLKNALGNNTTQALSGNYNWIWRDVDSIVSPIRGITSTIQLGSGYAFSNNAKDGLFTRVYTRNTLYYPLGRRWYAQLRGEWGQVFANSQVGIPEPLMFRAGGDDSVRGYGYRELGPTRNGVLVSGRKLITGSAEIQHPFTSRVPSVLWAAFIDAGNASDQWSDFKAAVGYGVGLRWRSPAGPFRIDLAYGEDLHKTRLHFSVGIVF